MKYTFMEKFVMSYGFKKNISSFKKDIIHGDNTRVVSYSGNEDDYFSIYEYNTKNKKIVFEKNYIHSVKDKEIVKSFCTLGLEDLKNLFN